MENKIKCRDCGSHRVLFDPENNRYNCSDCFGYFLNENTFVNTCQKPKFVWFVFSNMIEFFNHPIMEDRYDRYVVKNKCKNCQKENVETKIISLEEYSNLVIKSKNEVNPEIIKICPKCESKNIYALEEHVNKTYCCNGCDLKNFIPKVMSI